jgi:hypothetical protein
MYSHSVLEQEIPLIFLRLVYLLLTWSWLEVRGSVIYIERFSRD